MQGFLVVLPLVDTKINEKTATMAVQTVTMAATAVAMAAGAVTKVTAVVLTSLTMTV
jgi:hypothetical protein